ncbi:hypothetical protein DCO49_00415 [Stenotrophomonas sp. SPM]|nr:hypothetical protein DCO49_00415 [Stenotrophomonas sp. SPM]
MAGPGAFKKLLKLLKLLPELEERLTGYSGQLPKRNFPSSAFDNFFEKVRALIRDRVPHDRYPANDPTYARRSIVEFIKDSRRGGPFVDEGFEVEDAVTAGQLQEVFALQQGDWVQYDGHKLDAPFSVEGQDGDGNPFLQKIGCVWLIVGYFALLRICCSWSLSFASNYNGTDFNTACANSLRHWEPRELVSPSMKYFAGSGIGTWPVLGFVATGAITSLDNAMAHRLEINRKRMVTELRGVIHFGASGVPETRGLLEAWNRRREETAIRRLPGGFRPQGEESQKTHVNGGNPDNYPLQRDALEDLMDVVIAKSNIESHGSHQGRDPYDVLRSYAASGGWLFATRNAEERAVAMSKMIISARIKGSKKHRRQPYVQFAHARYRSIALKNRWDLVGTDYSAEVDIADGRTMHLYTKEGNLFVVLRALRPWGRTAHSLALRKLIHKRAVRGDIDLLGVEDAVLAYKTLLRARFCESKEAASSQLQHKKSLDAAETSGVIPKTVASRPSQSAPHPSILSELDIPLAGRVRIGRRKHAK